MENYEYEWLNGKDIFFYEDVFIFELRDMISIQKCKQTIYYYGLNITQNLLCF